MNWYYVEGGQQAGPVEEAQLFELVRSGKIQADTLVWREGMAAWRRYSEAAPPGAPSAAAPEPQPAAAGLGGLPAGTPGTVTCSECGRAFPPSEVIRYGDKSVCAACKPTFFQRVREGAPLGGPGLAAGASEAELLARDYEVDIGDYLTRAWELFKANAGILIGATVLVYLAMMAANLVPYLGILAALVLHGPLMGGLWAFYIRQVRNQQPTIGDAFSGFGPRFGQLLLTYLIQTLIAIGIMLVLILPAILVGLGYSRSGSGIGITLALVTGVLALLAVVAVTYLNTCWLFALPLVADKGLRFWPALELSRRVVSKHWWMTFALLIVAGLIGFLGVLACGLGLLVTGPVAFAMLSYHYQKVFGDLAPSQD